MSIVMTFISAEGDKLYLKQWQGSVDVELPGYCAMGILHHFGMTVNRTATADEIKTYPRYDEKQAVQAFLCMCFDAGARSLLLCDRVGGQLYARIVKQLGKCIEGRKVIITPTHVNRNSGNEVFECILQQDNTDV